MRSQIQSPIPDQNATDSEQIRKFYDSLTGNIQREHGFEKLRIEGKIPLDLNGTLFRNGPGQNSNFGIRYSHLFEGDGALSAVQIQNGEARAAVKLIQTQGLLAEEQAGKLLYGFAAPWRQRIYSSLKGRGKNTANTNVIYWQNRLLALMEGGMPTELDPLTLNTIGETNLEGLIPAAFSAHPHTVPSRKAMFNFGLRYGKTTLIDLFQLPLNGEKPGLFASIPLKKATVLHDFIATENYLVFFVAPIQIRVARFFLRLAPASRLMHWAPEEGTEIIVVPIDNPSGLIRFYTDAFHLWHFANGFEKNGELFIDYVRYPNFDTIKSFEHKTIGEEEGNRLHRARIDLVRKSFSSEELFSTPCEFPRVNPNREGTAHRFLWTVQLHSPAALHRFNADSGHKRTFQFPEQQFPSEPIFVPRPEASGETDGYVLTLVFDGLMDRSFLAVFHGDHPEDGPIAEIWLNNKIPFTFHGNFIINQIE